MSLFPIATGITIFLYMYDYLFDQFNDINSLLQRPIVCFSDYFTDDFSGTTTESKELKVEKLFMKLFIIDHIFLMMVEVKTNEHTDSTNED